jgi:predicted dehydrogenase
MTHRDSSRRRFLKQSAALASAAYFVNPARAAQAGERVRVAIIGINNQGASNITQLVRTDLAEIVALCDIDETRSAPVLRAHPKARFHTDYRRMLERERDIQAVLIATPDHHHAIPAIQAMRAGKHVYCEKPLAHSVHEVRAMVEAAERNRVVTQMGTQIHANENYHRVVELIQGGVIGAVSRVRVWCARILDPLHRVAQAAPVPQGLHYDLWQGPAPERHYPPFRLGTNTSVHFNWRWDWDYGGGQLGDMGCHFMDLPHWALGLRQPTSVVAQGRVTHGGDNNTMPDRLQVDYEYPARGNQPAVRLTWYHGVAGPDLAGTTTYAGYRDGVLFEGERGNLISDYGKHALLPEDRFQGVQLPGRTLARSPGHHREWLLAIKEGRTTSCPFSYSGPLAEAVLLGNVAYRCGNGVRLQYDARTGQVPNVAAASRYLRREYRAGWTI